MQAAPRILPTFPEELSRRAQQSLERIGVKVLADSKVQNIDAEGVMIADERTYSKSVIWAAGVVASPAAKWLKAESDGARRVKVESDLSVPNLRNVFVIGDAAASDAWHGRPVPGLAPAAKQGGVYIAKLITARVLGISEPVPFAYHHLGSLATIGRKSCCRRLRLDQARRTFAGLNGGDDGVDFLGRSLFIPLFIAGRIVVDCDVRRAQCGDRVAAMPKLPAGQEVQEFRGGRPHARKALTKLAPCQASA